jgi:hypothetical protein
MPKAPRRTTIKISAYFSPITYDKLVARSKQNYRSLTNEIVAAVEKSLQEEAEQQELPKVAASS